MTGRKLIHFNLFSYIKYFDKKGKCFASKQIELKYMISLSILMQTCLIDMSRFVTRECENEVEKLKANGFQSISKIVSLLRLFINKNENFLIIVKRKN